MKRHTTWFSKLCSAAWAYHYTQHCSLRGSFDWCPFPNCKMWRSAIEEGRSSN